jgi:hypothetical protein
MRISIEGPEILNSEMKEEIINQWKLKNSVVWRFEISLINWDLYCNGSSCLFK